MTLMFFVKHGYPDHGIENNMSQAITILIVGVSAIFGGQGILATTVPEEIYADIKPKHPHIVFILADDLGYNDIGYHAIHGMSAIRTPHLDTLAGQGVKLENYYVQSICSPSRSVFMTGRYLIRYGLQHDVFRAAQPTCLPLSETTLPEKLKELGYATHAIGKWHLGMCRTECLPTRRGFDSFFGYAVGGSDHYSHNKSCCQSLDIDSSNQFYDDDENFAPNDDDIWQERDFEMEAIKTPMSGKDLFEDEEPVWKHEGEYSANLFTEKAQTIISEHDPKNPLFLYLAYKNVHKPLQAPSVYNEMNDINDENRHKYAAMVSALDEGVKNVTDTLKQAGMWTNTVLVFSTDNGGSLRRHAGGNNWPLRGGKWSLWEGGVRAVGFVTSPLLSSKVKGTVNRELMHISDWFPTFVDGIAGGDTSQMRNRLDGVNQWDVIREGGRTTRKEVLLNIDHQQMTQWTNPLERIYWDIVVEDLNEDKTFNELLTTTAGIRSGKWKLLTGLQRSEKWLPPPESGMEEQDFTNTSIWKCTSSVTMVQLFELWEDPMEVCNVAYKPENKAVVINLLKDLQKYNKKSSPVYHPPVDPRADPAIHGGAWRPWLDDDINTLLKLYRIEL